MFCILLAYSLPQEMEIEATDDIMRQSGSGGGESYFGTPLPRLVASRVGWLVTVFFFFLPSHLFPESEGRLATPGILPEHLNRGHITKFLSLRPPIPILVRY